MEEKEFGRDIIESYGLDVDFDPLLSADLTNGVRSSEFTVSRNGETYKSEFQWGSGIDSNDLDESDVVYSLITDWNLYYFDPNEAFSMFEDIDKWNRYMEEIKFLESIFSESEADEIMEKYQKIY